MYLLVDCCTATFSNAARKAYTQIKKATLLGGMGSPVKNVNLTKIASLKQDRLNSIREVKSLGKGTRLQKLFLNGESNNIKNINNKIMLEKPTRSYVDAIQIARKGKTTPIKSRTYVDRSGYIQHPQDNTTLASTLNKIEKQTKQDGLERGVVLYKEKGKLKVPAIVKGNETSVQPDKSLPKNRQPLIDIHSHPINSPLPSIMDLTDKPNLKGATSLIVTPQNSGKRTITKYQTGDVDKLWNLRNIEKKPGYKKAIRSAGADYRLITPNKNQ